jgi:hypothetical protein
VNQAICIHGKKKIVCHFRGARARPGPYQHGRFGVKLVDGNDRVRMGLQVFGCEEKRPIPPDRKTDDSQGAALQQDLSELFNRVYITIHIFSQALSW